MLPGGADLPFQPGQLPGAGQFLGQHADPGVGGLRVPAQGLERLVRGQPVARPGHRPTAPIRRRRKWSG